ncbi:hypothetical protein EN858_31970 [Mesorhizobium sp. M4B.F.Ca.ET.215.01.1.1]|uniref:Uncharacterized protein n=1 Tax=Mesorhizobium abyssinicae TaxID=1209958 RepID=A0ABU5AFM9_9HYPH|nr:MULTISPECIES: hypothetical protein [Mesorhizobium]MDX8536097.1 hypothetical protein [Mesorhizobium abyssinicae]RUW18995.1 hypothetical protein EOA34_30725 [Mesorhizobium sp. M4B.F.Ca.ET.013.02.1.1]RVD33400.1 hypothetical protein EN741_32180 [Mesorhizobium sp. M4B.F.Ca.ET.019.03.1.1]RWF63673.1 MAG: hypothetical protein EOS47_17990 [Mesorhizobium sp.]TGQ04386.1 hypothetical protein EN858_31970 [Mesorhizobium sp. M4B.F.Ca.ET.215.01.1.1]
MVFMILSQTLRPRPARSSLAAHASREFFTRLGRPLGGGAIRAFAHSLVFNAKSAYMHRIDISADRSGLAIFAFADVYLQNFDTTGWT